MIKKILSVIFVLTMIISVFAGLDFTLPTASAVQIIKSGDYEYTVNDNNEITIKNYLGNDREVSIPSEINGMPVTEIGEYSFNGFKRYAENNSGFENHPNEWNNKRIRRISVPSTVRKICNNAFGNMDRLSEVVLVEGLETEQYGLAFNKADTDILEVANKVIAEMIEDGSLAESVSFHTDASAVTE